MTTEPLALSALGFLLGIRHATDADHVVAVATIACRERRARAAMAIGALWGLGHTATILLVGSAIILFDAAIPPRLGLSLEMAVAVMLVLLGVLNLARAVPHHPESSRGPARRGGRLRPLAIGVVHGLAGSGAIGLLVLTTIRSAGWAIVYLIVFGAGTVLGMMLMTTAMAFPLAAAARRFGTLERGIARVTGAVSVIFGAFLAYRLGVVDGLFSVAPRWTPR